MAQSNTERLDWRNRVWLHNFFYDFERELELCRPESLEQNIQNTQRYNQTRERCQFIFNYYLSRVERIVREVETTQPTRAMVEELQSCLEDILRLDIFEGIIDEVSERILPEEHQITNPMSQGNNQTWTESSLVNHYNTIYRYYMRVIVYLNNMNNVVGGRQKKYRKSKKAKKSRKAKRRKSKKSNK